MVDFLEFEIVITPYIVIIVYALGALLLPIIFYHLAIRLSLLGESLLSKTLFVITVLFSELMWRVLNEFIIVYFKIYQVLQE